MSFCFLTLLLEKGYHIYRAILPVIVREPSFYFDLPSVLGHQGYVYKIIFGEGFLVISFGKSKYPFFEPLIRIVLGQLLYHSFVFWILVTESCACLYDQY